MEFYQENTGWKRFAGAVLIAVIAFVLGWQATVQGLLADKAPMVEVGDSEKLSSEVDLSLFWTVWDELEDKYVDGDTISEEDKVYGAIKGLVNSYGDNYTVFMDPNESEEFSASLAGTLEGIGAELTMEDNTLTIVSPLRNSPAEKAGLLPQDVIYKIDGDMAIDLTLFEAVTKIRGEKGTTVTLTIIRQGAREPFDVSIVRDSIQIESVTSEDLEDGITYVSINQFNEKTEEEFSKVVSELKLNNDLNGLIVDLRFNGGGYLDISIDLLSHLLPPASEAVRIRERGKEEEVKYTSGNTKLLDVPIVVLVNEGSASASEIMAGALQDHGRAVIMGTQTFGKGSVQEVSSYSDGSSIRITIAKWFTPEGRGINKVGLTPDIIVELEEEDYDNKYDRQKEEAIKYLKEL